MEFLELQVTNYDYSRLQIFIIELLNNEHYLKPRKRYPLTEIVPSY